MFEMVRRRLWTAAPRRAIVETAEQRGVAAAIVELGGLPPFDDGEDDLPPPPTFGARRRGIPRRIAGRESGAGSQQSGGPDGRLPTEEGWRPGRAREPGVTRGPREVLARACRLQGVEGPRIGYCWQRERRWTFDLAWPDRRVAVVLDGGSRIGGRVVYGAGWIRDAQRLNEAAVEGWLVLRVTQAQVEDGSAARLIARALARA